jgi:signal transduction histidine kinase
VINNLIENAVYHSSEKKLKQVVEVGTEVVGTDICITIKDQGKGIQQDELEKIFDPFNMTQKGKGRSGLGLSVVYNLVTQILEGKIRCLSEPGHGTMFEVTFPYKPAI